MQIHEPKFAPGQVVYHLKFHYRGVIVAVDAEFSGTSDWYDEVALSRPPKNEPWYHVLVHEAHHETYVAQRHLQREASGLPIDHPVVSHYFDEFRDGVYVPRRVMN